MLRFRHLSVAIPMLAECDNIPHLLDLFRSQCDCDFTLYLCVNQPEGWNIDPQHRDQYLDNQQTLYLLRQVSDLDIVLLDYSSPGHGWQGKQKGVGWARKVLFDKILEQRGPDELIVSLDADTDFSDTYLSLLLQVMNQRPDYAAVCVPFYHPLSGDDVIDRSMLRYECYMRHYFIQLMLIRSPYAFSALGSAMAFPLWSYSRVGGITPLQGGEDFYLMQKFSKTGRVLCSADPRLLVKPQGRISLRVPFGTGPAVAQGVEAQQNHYPFYPQQGFDDVAVTTAFFSQLYDCDIETPLSSFLRQQLKTDDLWAPLRKNFKRADLFIHACHERVDGLRILQYLKQCSPDPLALQHFCALHNHPIPNDFSFQHSSVEQINTLRDSLFRQEMELRSQM